MDQKLMGVIQEVKLWSSKLTDPFPEVYLIQMLEGQINTRVSRLAGSDLLTAQQNVEAAVFQSTLQDNFTRIKAKIQTIRKEAIKPFQQSRKVDPSVSDPSHCFQSIQHLRVLLEADINTVIDQLIPAESDTRRFLNIEEVLDACEGELLTYYEKKKDEGLLRLEKEFNSLFQPRKKWAEELVNCDFFRLDRKLMDCYEISKAETIAALRLFTNLMLPKTLEIRYERRMKDEFVEYGNELIQEKYIPEIRGRMNSILGEILNERGALELFDDQVTNAAVRELVLAAAYMSISREGFLPGILRLEGRFSSLGTELVHYGDQTAFYQGVADFQAQATFDQQCFLVLSLLLLLNGAGSRPVEDLPQCDYSAAARLLYRSMVSTLFASNVHGQLLNIDAWILGRSAELALATFLAEINHPLLSGLPAKILEEIAQYGGQHGFDKAMTLQEAPALPFTRRLAYRVIKEVLYLSSQPLQMTFAWRCLNPTPSIDTTLVISGFLSKNSDHESDWMDLLSWPLQGTVLALQWDADSIIEYFGKSALETALAIPFGLRAILHSAISGPVELFKNARKKGKKTAKMLADQIRAQAFGQGSITIVAFSLGCYVVQRCLQYLAKDPLIPSPILDVVLLGGAVSSYPEKWSIAKQVVQGRLVNVFSRKDGVLQYLYRFAMAGKNPPIGLEPIACEGVENYDASDFIGGHMDHRKLLKNDLWLCDYKP